MAKMKTTLLAAMVATTLGAPASAAAPGPTMAPGPTIETLLSGYEYVPTAEDWARAGSPAEVAAELMRIADDPTQGVQRQRALSSLAHFPGPATEAFLSARAGDPATPTRLRGKALIAWGFVARDRAAPMIAAFLTEPDAGLREDAVRALRVMAAPEVEAFLAARVAREPVPHVKAALSGAATQVRGKRAALQREKATVPSVSTMPKALPAPRAK